MLQRLLLLPRLASTLAMLVLTSIAFGQTAPTFYTGNTNSPSNSFPFNTAGGKALQSLIAPAEFNSPTGTAQFGNITSFYVQGTANITGIWSNLTVKMGQTTATTLPTGALYTGPMSTVYTATTTTLTSTAAGWLKITLQTPFLYDPSKSLVVEITQCASTGGGFSVTNVSKSGFRRTWNSSTCTNAYSGQDANLFNCGVDMSSASNNDIGVFSVDSPGMYCAAGPKNVVVTLKNYGINQITSATVNWSANGVAQTPYSFSGLLDTMGGANPTVAQINLGSYTFPATPVTIKAWSASPNSNTDTIPQNDTASLTRQASMAGNFTIDPAGSGANNFLTFNDAISAISLAGLCGPVTFTVAAGTYTGQIVVPDIAGTSPVNTITFDGVDPSTRILTFNGNGGTFVLNGTKYVTFKNFTVNNPGTGTPAGIAFVGAVRTITIRNCKVNLNIQTGTSSTGYCINGTGSLLGAGVTAFPGDSIWIDSCITTGGGYGIILYGSSNATMNRGHRVTNNIINNCNYMGGYIAYNYNPTIVTNNVFNMQGQNYGYYGLYFYYNQSSNTTTSHQVISNKVTGFTGYGIYAYYPVNVTNAAVTKIYNNMLQSHPANGSYPGYYGIYMYNYNASTYAEVYHNTVIMNNTGTSTSYTAFYNTGSTQFLLKNNIFAVYGGSGCPAYLATAPAANTQVDYNIYYNGANPVSGNVIYRGGFFLPTNYKTATAGGLNSTFTNPSFVSRLPFPGDLHVTDGCDGVGTPLTAVTTDIDGQPRSLTTPTPGADEFAGGANNNLRVLSLLSPSIPVTAGTQDLRFVVKNIGANTVTSYNANYKNNGGTALTVARTVNMSTCGLDTAVFTGANQVTIGAVNNLTLYSSLPNSSPDSDPNNDTLKVGIYTPLNGTYTVGGTTPDFPNVVAAANALAFGVSGPVRFDIRPGTYTGQVVVSGLIPGANATNRVIFDGNDRTSRTIIADVPAAAFLINQSSYVTVQNLKIVNTNTGNCAGVAVVGTSASTNARCNIIKNNDVQIPI